MKLMLSCLCENDVNYVGRSFVIEATERSFLDYSNVFCSRGEIFSFIMRKTVWYWYIWQLSIGVTPGFH